MKYDRTILLNTLKLLQPALATKEVIEQSASFVFVDEKVVAYNNEIAISVPIDTNINGAVKAVELTNLLSKLKDKEISIEVTKNELSIRGKRAKAGIRLEENITLPLEEMSVPGIWKPLPHNFIDALSFCYFSAGKDTSKPMLTCIHVCETHAESCDNVRLSRYELKSFQGDLLIPATAAKLLCDYKPTEYEINGGWGHFRNTENVVFSIRVFEGKYPDISPFISLEDSHTLKPPSELSEILDRASVFSQTAFSNNEYVEITLKGRDIIIRGEGESGWFEETRPVRWSGSQQIKFSIHPKFLQQAIKHKKEILISEKSGRLRIDGDNFIHVILLMPNL